MKHVAPMTQSCYEDLSINELVQASLDREDSRLSADGALCVTTGKRTGRSPKDRYMVCDENTENTVDWGAVNQKVTLEHFEKLWSKALNYLSDKETFVSNLCVGADQEHHIPVRVTTELAWQNLFARHMFVRPDAGLKNNKEQWQIVSAANLVLDPAVDGTNGDGCVMIDLSNHRVLLCGMRYAGEMKKAMFSVMNYFMPEADVLPMHCAANEGPDGDVALFFGLSGTGKTTLSADPDRFLIGDDEHGWSATGVFNFEGGCYAKCIDLSKEREPVIWNAIRDGAIMENVVIDEAGVPDFKDSRYTLNSRSAYPREHISKRVDKNAAGIPKAVLFLTCDLYGVLPPVALLNEEQAAYYFLSGYTALVGSTEVGSTDAIKPTFSTCFGAPFFPRPATVYAELLIKRVREAGAQVYLINTGWTGGAYGAGGERFSIPDTRAIVSAAISGETLKQEGEILPGFNFKIPKHLAGVDTNLLDPRNGWSDKKAYDAEANVLIKSFRENFAKFDVSQAIKDSAPEIIV